MKNTEDLSKEIWSLSKYITIVKKKQMEILELRNTIAKTKLSR